MPHDAIPDVCFCVYYNESHHWLTSILDLLQCKLQYEYVSHYNAVLELCGPINYHELFSKYYYLFSN